MYNFVKSFNVLLKKLQKKFKYFFLIKFMVKSGLKVENIIVLIFNYHEWITL